MGRAFLLMACLLTAAQSEPARACGIKNLIPGAGAQYGSVNAAVHPGVVLLYRNPDSGLATHVMAWELEMALGLAGHIVDSVETREQLDAAIASGEYDVVLLDVRDAPTQTITSMRVLPIVEEAPDDFAMAITPADDADEVIRILDELLAK